MNENQVKGKPVPVRFERDECTFLDTAAQETGLGMAELVRRSVRLLKRERERENGFGFIINLVRN